MKRLLFVIFLIVLISLIGLKQKSQADNLYEEQNLSIEEFKVQINLLANTQLEVQEDISFATRPVLPFKWPIFATNIYNVQIACGNALLSSRDFQITKSSKKTILLIKNAPADNPAWRITYRVKNKMKYYPQYDELHWIGIFENGAFIRKAAILLKLPKPMAPDCSRKIYSYGLQKAYSKKSNSSTLIYEAQEIEPYGNFTIVALLPKGLIQPSFLGWFLFKLSSLDFWAGILVALLITSLTWTIMQILSLRQKKEIIPSSAEISTSPPNQTPAALIGVLLNKKLGVREFAATFIELAHQGFLTMVQEKRNFYLIKRKPFDKAKPAEQALINEVFEPFDSQERIAINLADLKSSERERISSSRISQSSTHIYKIINALGYFRADPHEIYLRYLKLSIGIFFVASIGLLVSLKLIYTYPVIPFIFVGFILATFIIPQKAPALSLYTACGKKAAYQWLKFKNFLKQTKTTPRDDIDEFFKFLPYAIVMGVEKKWASQFNTKTFKPPFWLDIGYGSYDLEKFTKEFLPLIYDLAYTLIEMREPTAR